MTKINGKLKDDLEEGQERETIINNQSEQLNVQKLEREHERTILENEKCVLQTALKNTKAREDEAKRDLDVKLDEVESLKIAKRDLSQRLHAQEQARIEADTGRKAAEDRCHMLQNKSSEQSKSLKDLGSRAEEVNRAFSQAIAQASALKNNSILRSGPRQS